MDRFLVWGTGKVAARCYDVFTAHKSGMLENCEIVCFVDNDIKQKWFKGKTVIRPSEMNQVEYDYICIWVGARFEKEIIKQITEELCIPRNRVLDIFTPFKRLLHERYINSVDIEILEMLDKIDSRKWLDIYYFEPKNKPKGLSEVFYDSNADLYYSLFEGKRMYLKRSYGYFTEINGTKYVGDMWGEQDLNSPHLYEEGSVKVEEGDVLVDAGVCEGNFSLHNIDKPESVNLTSN